MSYGTSLNGGLSAGHRLCRPQWCKTWRAGLRVLPNRWIARPPPPGISMTAQDFVIGRSEEFINSDLMQKTIYYVGSVATLVSHFATTRSQ